MPAAAAIAVSAASVGKPPAIRSTSDEGLIVDIVNFMPNLCRDSQYFVFKTWCKLPYADLSNLRPNCVQIGFPNKTLRIVITVAEKGACWQSWCALCSRMMGHRPHSDYKPVA